ncbi:hypothetical protein GCM10010174_03760 [Kutzneria viridogrisea]|uniref:Uncharacterized protein n=1 Tax=Kutzneria viridogrisea TaxID=47990 RepID=A0ABR6BS89_9PSEU|nr:hypothetical protein [Kutzneria viridogrisea]
MRPLRGAAVLATVLASTTITAAPAAAPGTAPICTAPTRTGFGPSVPAVRDRDRAQHAHLDPATHLGDHQ